MAEITVRVLHDRHFDLVRDESADEGALDGLTETQTAKVQGEGHVLSGGKVYPSLGVYQVASMSRGVEDRHKIEVKQSAHYTDLQLPGDYDPSPQALTHLIESLKDRMIGEFASGVALIGGDGARVVSRLAVLLDVDVVEA